MSNELIVFTHNDLDALGCMLNIEYKLPNVKKKYFHTNYANIDTIVDEILSYAEENGNTHIIIPDVSFSDNKDSLRRLYNKFSSCSHIDHHMYPEGFWDEFPNMKVVWDKTKSATLLCNEHLDNTGKNERLDKLSRLIDVYDIWQEKHPAFDIAQDLNNYFWENEIGFLFNAIVQNNYKLPDNYMAVVQNIKNRYTAAIADYEKRNLIHRSNGITFAFVDEWFNQVLLQEMASGQKFVIGLSSYGIVRVRVNQFKDLKESDLNELRLRLTGNAEYGHLHAFTYKVKESGLDAIMAEAQKIANNINDICG